MNDLTKRLLAQGYDKNNHPDYVKWSNWKDFEYTRDALLTMIWESPCGLIMKGDGGYNHGSHLGVDYCPENDNPRYGCPYHDEVPCEHRFDIKLWGWNCAFHQIARDYDYEISVEKLWDEWDKIQSEAWHNAVQSYGYCACMRWERKNRAYIPKYQVDECIQYGCTNEICAISKQARNLQRVNIYYDILREWRYKKGLFETVDRKIEKGVRKFKKAIARTDAEIWLQTNSSEFEPTYTPQDRRDAFFSEMHGDTGFGDYDYFYFSSTPQNIRIECRESRDLMQDLADIAEGIEVVHASDFKKRAQEDKRERKRKRQDAKKRRVEKSNIKKWVDCLVDDNASGEIKQFAKDCLNKLGLDNHGKPVQPEQLSLCDNAA